ncbi:uncharacterized protein MONBRDRAFT_33657 [Monosiga brevicollis MX1]|uniref:Rubicon Homology domain-containing protein n=1 Tax=Monosiga brevicollis TaxID=81824 RepID=A9V6U3_MONBE|nr:uncharacterized protein MONBRDRAFT_33657 [Monosiga brevicollis MX1]EDQ86794.1 predicted protein [Monosiga brevicollis MX1]|eukprot:XP_001748339.1 hypothetical protein [Monosiga brevicollis MX1]
MHPGDEIASSLAGAAAVEPLDPRDPLNRIRELEPQYRQLVIDLTSSVGAYAQAIKNPSAALRMDHFLHNDGRIQGNLLKICMHGIIYPKPLWGAGHKAASKAFIAVLKTVPALAEPLSEPNPCKACASLMLQKYEVLSPVFAAIEDSRAYSPKAFLKQQTAREMILHWLVEVVFSMAAHRHALARVTDQPPTAAPIDMPAVAEMRDTRLQPQLSDEPLFNRRREDTLLPGQPQLLKLKKKDKGRKAKRSSAPHRKPKADSATASPSSPALIHTPLSEPQPAASATTPASEVTTVVAPEQTSLFSCPDSTAMPTDVTTDENSTADENLTATEPSVGHVAAVSDSIVPAAAELLMDNVHSLSAARDDSEVDRDSLCPPCSLMSAGPPDNMVASDAMEQTTPRDEAQTVASAEEPAETSEHAPEALEGPEVPYEEEPVVASEDLASADTSVLEDNKVVSGALIDEALTATEQDSEVLAPEEKSDALSTAFVAITSEDLERLTARQREVQQWVEQKNLEVKVAPDLHYEWCDDWKVDYTHAAVDDEVGEGEMAMRSHSLSRTLFTTHVVETLTDAFNSVFQYLLDLPATLEKYELYNPRHGTYLNGQAVMDAGVADAMTPAHLDAELLAFLHENNDSNSEPNSEPSVHRTVSFGVDDHENEAEDEMFCDIDIDVLCKWADAQVPHLAKSLLHVKDEKQLDFEAVNQLLEAQDRRCAACRNDIVATDNDWQQSAQVCFFTGRIYCHVCQRGNREIIPARAINLCDFTSLPVSDKAAAALGLLQMKKFYDVDDINKSPGLKELNSVQLPEWILQQLAQSKEKMLPALEECVRLRKQLYDLLDQAKSKGQLIKAQDELAHDRAFYGHEYLFDLEKKPSCFTLSDFAELGKAQSAQHSNLMHLLRSANAKIQAWMPSP